MIIFATLLRELGISSYAILAIVVGWRVGKWFDDDAERKSKDEFRQALKSAAWLPYLKTAYEFAGEALDRFFGNRLNSLYSASVSIGITFAASVFTGIFFYFHHYEFYNADPLWFSIYFAALRFVPSVMVDYVTLLRVRLTCRRIQAGRSVLGITCLSIIADVVTFVIFAEIVQAVLIADSSLRYPDEDGPVLQNVINVFTHAGYVLLGALREAGNLRIFAVTATVGAVGALAPALIFYLYTSAIILLRIICNAGSGIAFLSGKMKFTNPFTAVGITAGSILAALTLVVDRLLP